MDAHVVHRVVRALVGDGLRGPESADQWDHLVGPPAALVHRDLTGAELLRVLPADAHAGDEATPGRPVEVGRLLRDQRRGIEG